MFFFVLLRNSLTGVWSYIYYKLPVVDISESTFLPPQYTTTSLLHLVK